MKRSSVHIVETRLARPRLPGVLRRQRLIRRLVRGVTDYPIITVTAGAGYGKTTLVASLAEAANGTCLWYSLGAEDADFAVFLTHLSTALRRESLRYARSMTAFLREGPLPAKPGGPAAGAFLNDISRIREPLVIILDDLHLVSESPEIGKFLSEVLENNNGPVRFVLSGRTQPPLPLGRLRARGQILELGPADLAFTREEFRALFNEIYLREISEEELGEVETFTGGWVAALRLALQGTIGPETTGIIEALRRAQESSSRLHDYLADEVLALQSPELQTFMLQTAMLEELRSDLLKHVLPGESAESHLVTLLRRNLVQAFEGADGTSYQYHALLQSHLQRRGSEILDPEERDRIHAAAAAYYREQDNVVACGRHLALSRDTAPLVDFLGERALRLLDLGYYQSLRGWLDALPDALLDAHPGLRLRRADVRYYLGLWPDAEIEYTKSQQAFGRAGDISGEAWAILGQARIWNLTDRAETSTRECRAALDRLSSDGEDSGSELLIRLHQVLSAAHFYLGQYGRALDVQDGLEPLILTNPERLAALWNNRAVIHASRGNFPAAAQAFERGLKFPGARRSPRASLHLTNLAILLTELGDTERARPLLDEALSRGRRSSNRSQILTALMGQAHLAHRVGEHDRCLELIREVEEMNDGPSLPMIRADALALRAEINAASGQIAAARALIREAVEAYGATNRDANWLHHRVQASVIELAAGRTEEAHEQFSGLLAEAESMEAMFPRALILFHLGEAARRLGRADGLDRLVEALELGMENGYGAFFRGAWRQFPGAFEQLLRADRGAAAISRLAAGAGAGLEPTLLPLLGDADLPESSARALLTLVEEVGGAAAHRRLTGSAWRTLPSIAPATEACLRVIEMRYPELGPKPVSGPQGIRIETLGSLRLIGRNGEIPAGAWKSQRALSVFIYLALRGGRGATKERLLDLFWPGTSGRKAQQNFHPTLSYARRALRGESGGTIFLVSNGVYRLDPDLHVTVDARLFEARLSEMDACTTQGRKIRLAEEALALYRGDFLEDRYEAWAEDLRSSLSLRYEAALIGTAGLHLEKGHIEEALAHYRRGAARNPLSEDAHVGWMECLRRRGDRRGVDDVYQGLVRRLRDDLGVDPMPATRRRYEALIGNMEGSHPA